jgi:hypothetical protein
MDKFCHKSIIENKAKVLRSWSRGPFAVHVLGVSGPLCFSSSAIHFSHYSFLIHHPVTVDGQHLLAHAMASDFSVAWQLHSKLIAFTLLMHKEDSTSDSLLGRTESVQKGAVSKQFFMPT